MSSHFTEEATVLGYRELHFASVTNMEMVVLGVMPLLLVPGPRLPLTVTLYPSLVMSSIIHFSDEG